MSNPCARSRLLLISSLVLATIGSILTIVVLQSAADKSRRVQIDLRSVEANTQEIRSTVWESIARNEITSSLAEEIGHARRELLGALAQLASEDRHGPYSDPLIGLSVRYQHSVDRELEAIRSKRFEEARELHRTESEPDYSRLKRTIDQLNAVHQAKADEFAAGSKFGLSLVSIISTGIILFLFRSFEVEHRVGLAAAEELALRHSEERFRALTENSSDIVFVLNVDGFATYVSPSVKRVLGWQEQEVLGRVNYDRVHPQDVARVKTARLAVAEGVLNQATVEYRFRHKDGSWLHLEVVIHNLLQDKNVKGLLHNIRNITERKKAEEQLRFHAGHDALTQLPNRAAFLRRLQGVIARARRRSDRSAALLFVDVDDFKVVNDSLGHRAGDQLIVEMAERLKSCLRTGDTVARAPESLEGESPVDDVARLGGDEFTILLEDIGDPGNAIRVAQRILESLARPFTLSGQEIFKSASIGIAFTSPGATPESLLANADLAMYRAKRNGKSRCEIFDSEMHTQVTKRLGLETALRSAVEKHELRLHYQPIISMTTGRVAGFEALVRWQRPGIGLVPPGDFIMVAEDTGLIVPLGKWVLQEACREGAHWNRNRNGQPLFVSINASCRQFSYPGFVNQVAEAVEKSGIDIHQVHIEITESAAMEDARQAESVIDQLHSMGIKCSIDDFGTGYSSLSSLRRFRLNTLKIDRSFISTMHTDPQSYAIVKTIVALARNLEMEVVAEGVENIEQLEKLRSVCDLAQGYLFSKPVPFETVLTLLDLHFDQLIGKSRSHTAGG